MKNFASSFDSSLSLLQHSCQLTHHVNDSCSAGRFSKLVSSVTLNILKPVKNLFKSCLFPETDSDDCQIIDPPPLSTVYTTPITCVQICTNQVQTSPILCRFCGSEPHERKVCPARHHQCDFCRHRGHYRSVCEKLGRLSKGNPLISCSAFIPSLAASTVPVLINGTVFNALVDTGSTYSFIDSKVASHLKLPSTSQIMTVSLASSNKSVVSKAYATLAEFKIGDFTHNDFKISIIDGLCYDVLLGHDLFSKHSAVKINFNGSNDMLSIDQFSKKGLCGVSKAKIQPVPLFHTITSDCKPIACKSRRYSEDDQLFIREEVAKLKAAGIVEECSSPWRAQVLVTRDDDEF